MVIRNVRGFFSSELAKGASNRSTAAAAAIARFTIEIYTHDGAISSLLTQTGDFTRQEFAGQGWLNAGEDPLFNARRA
jgi:hypothetical protein